MTLIELTVAMAIGLFLIGGALYVYSQSKNSYRASDSLARLQESARFALDTLEPDVRLARYWGLNSEPALITVPAGLAVDLRWRRRGLGAGGLSSAAVEAQGRRLRPPLLHLQRRAQGWQRRADPPACGALAGQCGAAGRTTAACRCRPPSPRGACSTTVSSPLAPSASTNNVAVNVYYVSNESSFDPALPSLRRLTLGPDGEFDDQEVIRRRREPAGAARRGHRPGRRRGSLRGRRSPAGHVRCARTSIRTARSSPCGSGCWSGRLPTIRAWVDERRYATPDADLGDLVAGSDDYPSTFRRLQISKTIFLNNEGA